MVKVLDLSKYLGYTIAAVSFGVGVIFVTGLFMPATIPTQLRIMCGVVFILMSVYRFVATRYKEQERGRAEQ